MSIIQTRPSAPSIGSSANNPFVISNTGSLVIDSVKIANVIAIKWIVSIRDSITNETSVFEVLATHNDVDATHSVYSVLGQRLSVSVDVKIDGPDLVFEMTSNVPNDVEVRIMNVPLNL